VRELCSRIPVPKQPKDDGRVEPGHYVVAHARLRKSQPPMCCLINAFKSNAFFIETMRQGGERRDPASDRPDCAEYQLKRNCAVEAVSVQCVDFVLDLARPVQRFRRLFTVAA
jgi:hypothetical protein